MNEIKEEIKVVIKEDAFYIEPKDSEIIYLNVNRLDTLIDWFSQKLTDAKVEENKSWLNWMEENNKSQITDKDFLDRITELEKK